jgi:non-ribosomal peptide synthetase component F
MWACHLAGCIYTPVHPTLPALSKRYILENTRAAFLLCSAAALPEPDAVPHGVRVIAVDPSTLCATCDSCASATLSLPPIDDHHVTSMSVTELKQLLEVALNGRVTQPGDTAYYIHTSGSTGKPKCVVHVHSSLDWHSHVTLLGSGLTRVDDVCLQVADCSFDLHIRDIFCFISTGGHVVTIPPAALADMQLLCDLFQRYR